MKKLEDALTGEDRYTISLVKLTGLKIVDIEGFVSWDDNAGEPALKLTEVIFEGGYKVDVEGEHEFPYLSTYGDNLPPNLDDETICELYNESEG